MFHRPANMVNRRKGSTLLGNCVVEGLLKRFGCPVNMVDWGKGRDESVPT